LRTLELIENPKADPQPQKGELASPAPKIEPFDAMIDFGFPADRVRNFVRGLSSQPGAYTFFRGKRVKILSCRVHESHDPNLSIEMPPGMILPGKKKLLVRCANSVIEVGTLLPEGKKAMNGVSFLNGVRPQPGECFGGVPEGDKNYQG